MSTKNVKQQDQAWELRERMNVHSNGEVEGQEYKPKEIDVLNLPSRSETHQKDEAKKGWKIQYPLIRLLVVIFVILILFLPLYHLWLNNGQERATTFGTTKRAVQNVNLMDGKTYVVKEGDTLAAISMKFYGSESYTDKLKKANRLSSDEVDIGQKLLIPNR